MSDIKQSPRAPRSYPSKVIEQLKKEVLKNKLKFCKNTETPDPKDLLNRELDYNQEEKHNIVERAPSKRENFNTSLDDGSKSEFRIGSNKALKKNEIKSIIAKFKRTNSCEKTSAVNSSLNKYFDSNTKSLNDSPKVYSQAKSRNSLSTVTHSKIILPKVAEVDITGNQPKSPNLTFAKDEIEDGKVDQNCSVINTNNNPKAYKPKRVVQYSGSDNEKLPSSYLKPKKKVKLSKNKNNLNQKTLDSLSKIQKVKPSDSKKLMTLSPYKYQESFNNTIGSNKKMKLGQRESSVPIKPPRKSSAFSKESPKIFEDREFKVQEYGVPNFKKNTRDIFTLRRQKKDHMGERQKQKVSSSYRNYSNSVLRNEIKDISSREQPRFKHLQKEKPRFGLHESFDIKKNKSSTEKIFIRSDSNKLDALRKFCNPKTHSKKYKRELLYSSHLPKINNLKNKIIKSYAEILPSVLQRSLEHHKPEGEDAARAKLDQIKNTIIVNYGGFSEGGCDQRVAKKENQDSYLTFVNFNKSQTTNSHLFSVCDGHGLSGKSISDYLVKNLAKFLKVYLNKEGSNPSYSLLSAFRYLDYKLEMDGLEATNSGSTCCTALVIGKKIYFANTGDSRALYVTFDPMEDTINPSEIESTIDHSCEAPSEVRRIKNKGGRISRIQNNLGPLRVWLQNEQRPGLAMARSVGDHCARKIGVIATPDIFKFEISRKSALIIGSDGLYQYLTNEEICQIVWDNWGKDGDIVSEIVVNKAISNWDQKHSYRDDITCVVAYLKPNFDN
ncbi:unnamed protein product [Moneuplotes crassus]|uniref:PPM-type phosphatase domain-containing protein n=1 Tax=Euplotes crassus TaxID=5936 RepID=A0AAD1Y6C4_EUPCR|nr:unnamed protein product [Moneuplotes crassus]